MVCSWNNHDYRKVNSQLLTEREAEGVLSARQRRRGALSAAAVTILYFLYIFGQERKRGSRMDEYEPDSVQTHL